MNRREFLRKTLVRGAQTTAAVAVTGAALARDTASQGAERAGEQMAAMRKRLDRLEARHDKLVKAGLVLAGISLGIDVSLLV